PGPPAISPGQRALLARLRGSGRPLIFTALQSPYVLSEVPDLPTTLVTWGPAEPSQRALAAALSGERPIRGKLPVTLPGVRPRGHGLVREARPMRLQPSTPREAGFDPGRWQAVEQGIEDAVMHRAFPGAVIAVGHDGRLVGPLAFGRLSYGGD